MGRNYKDVSGENNPNYQSGIAGTPLGNTWCNMKQRCLNANHPKYHRYGGRGVTIHEDWLTSAGFKEWALSAGYEEGLCIDRVDNDGNYEPDNCKWVTMSENARKKRTTKITLEQAGTIRERLSAGENANSLAAEYGVVHGTIWFIQKNFTHVADGECTRMLKERNLRN